MNLPRFDFRQAATHVFTWGLVLAALGLLTTAPRLALVADDWTEIKLVIRTSGKLLGECTVIGPEEMAKLPPNMRRPMECPREKSTVFARMKVDDRVYFEQTIVPSGIHNDGVVAAYHAFKVPAGPALIDISIKDDERKDAFTHVFQQNVTLSPDRILVVHFDDAGLSIGDAP